MINLSSKRGKATVLAAGLGVLAFGGVLASAASLGTLSNASLGSGVQTVASCDTDGVTVTYTNSFDTTSGKYKVTSVTIAGINVAAGGCTGKNLALTLKDAANAAQGTGSGVVATTSQVFAVTGNTDASVVTGAAVVIAD
jgi:hypothetical protein